MIPAPFTYLRASSVDDALDLVTEHGDEAKFLAGGHSLLPLMKLRLAQPEVLIDLAALRELSYIRDAAGHIAIGALTRHHDLEQSELLAQSVPLLAHAAGQVGDPQIRHRGTLGGSLAHGDPASDLPAVILALDATLVARGPSGTREIAAAGFFQGLFETALEPDELLVEVQVPKPAERAGRSRSSPSGPSTGPSSGSPCRAARWPWSTWPAPRSGPPRWSAPWPAARAPATRRRTPPKGPARSKTSTPPRPTGSTWPGS